MWRVGAGASLLPQAVDNVDRVRYADLRSMNAGSAFQASEVST